MRSMTILRGFNSNLLDSPPTNQLKPTRNKGPRLAPVSQWSSDVKFRVRNFNDDIIAFLSKKTSHDVAYDKFKLQIARDLCLP